jgi:hypothetical protein
LSRGKPQLHENFKVQSQEPEFTPPDDQVQAIAAIVAHLAPQLPLLRHLGRNSDAIAAQAVQDTVLRYTSLIFNH